MNDLVREKEMRVRYLFFIFLLSAIIIFFNLRCASPQKKSSINKTPSEKTAAVSKKPAEAGEEKQAKPSQASTTSTIPPEVVKELETKPVEAEQPENSSQTEVVYSLYQEAQIALEKGELDQALDWLDQAYAALLNIDASPESPLYQEKHDLRILIIQKIQQIYAFRLPPPGTNHKTIPLVENRWVQSEINLFQSVERRFFEEAYQRSGLYRLMIAEEMKKAGLPEELSWLPLIESGFRPRAMSRARALGLWQFIASTGYRYGLRRDKFVDERMDPIKSTRAAIRYLTELHNFFGDWTTAIASYNCGEIRVQNVIKAQKIDYLDNFWDLFSNLPYETARYVPRFIAALLIIENPEKYGFNLPALPPSMEYEIVKLAKPVKLPLIASRTGLSPETLSLFNPELRYDSTPDYEYELRVPVGYGEKTLACLAELPSWIPPDAVYGWHTVRKGETLGLIARRYRTTVRAIVRLNNLRSSTLIYPGQKLKIPGRIQGLPADEEERSPGAPNTRIKLSPGQEVDYVVKAGDTLYQIARTYGVTVEKIKRDNGLLSDNLTVGQKLTIKID